MLIYKKGAEVSLGIEDYIPLYCAIFFILDILYWYRWIGIYIFINQYTPHVHLTCPSQSLSE